MPHHVGGMFLPLLITSALRYGLKRSDKCLYCTASSNLQTLSVFPTRWHYSRYAFWRISSHYFPKQH